MLLDSRLTLSVCQPEFIHIKRVLTFARLLHILPPYETVVCANLITDSRGQGSEHLFLNGQMIILGFVGNTMPVTTTQLHCHTGNAARDNTYMNRRSVLQ